MRKIPSVMFSQHPDNAASPYWHSKPYIETHHELYECYLMFKELGAQEYMWDWEGKLVDESVIERLLQEYPEFLKNPLAKKFLLRFGSPIPQLKPDFVSHGHLWSYYLPANWHYHMNYTHLPYLKLYCH